MKQLLNKILSIPSPTFQEAEIAHFLQSWALQSIKEVKVLTHRDSLILRLPWTQGKPHIALIGHTDVVPKHFAPYTKQGLMYGAGASDMKGGLAAHLTLLKEQGHKLLSRFNLSMVLYAREEGTPMEENGLHDLIFSHPDYFQSIDLAIVGEPTNNTIQLGCVGSLHASVTIRGQSCHSARPWTGVNALYKALPFIEKMAKLVPEAHDLFGVTFFDTIQITESESQKGRTTLPAYWRGNLNYRYAPVRSPKQAEEELRKIVESCETADLELAILDNAPAGSIVESELFKTSIAALNSPVEAKQAWTDVAQLTALNIPAFNFGPGLTDQAHKENEFIALADLDLYYSKLTQMFHTIGSLCC